MMSHEMKQAITECVNFYTDEVSVSDVTRVNVDTVIQLEDHAERLNHVEVRRLLGLPRADRWSFDAE